MTQTAPFMVFALPRSRTAWLSKFLSFDPWTCHHDPSASWHSTDDLIEFLSRPYVGAADSGLVILWKRIRELSPKCRFVVVRRPRWAVEESLKRFDITIEPKVLNLLEQHLDEVSALPGTVTVNFCDLYSAETCGSLFVHCLLRPLSIVWWRALHDVNIQADLREKLAQMALNRDGIAKVYEGARQWL